MLLYELITKRYLTERATSVLYHFTQIEKAANILISKQFRLNSSYARDDEYLNGVKDSSKRPFYLSTARTPQSSFIRDRKYIMFGVIFDLNGDWFNNHGYRVKPVDYFQGTSPEKKEHEDRVFSKDPVIKFKGNDLIRSVHIYMKQRGGEPEPNKVLHMLVASRKSGIRTYVYDDFDAFLLQNTAKSIDLKTVVAELKSALKWSKYKYRDTIGDRQKQNNIVNDRNTKINLAAIRNLILAKKPEDLNKETIWLFDRTIRDRRYGAGHIKTLFKTILSSPNPEYGRKLLQLVKASKIPPNEIFEKLSQKWIGLSYMVDTKSGVNPYTKNIPTPDEESIF